MSPPVQAMMAWCQIGDKPLPEAMKNHTNDAVRNYAILAIFFFTKYWFYQHDLRYEKSTDFLKVYDK